MSFILGRCAKASLTVASHSIAIQIGLLNHALRRETIAKHLAERRRSFRASSTIKQPVNDLDVAPSAGDRAEDTGKVLDAYIGPGLQLMEQSLDLDGREMTLVVPRSSDAVIDMYLSAEQWDRDPYWCRPWPAAVALAAHILQHPELVRGRRVCEVGSGLGIAGIAAAMAGASQVVLTDREPLALECALLTAKASFAAAEPEQIVARHLDWTDPDPALGRFDVVLAADVLYESPAVEPMSQLIPKLLPPAGGSFILADPEARTRAHRQQFLRLMTTEERHPMSVETLQAVAVPMDNRSVEVQVVVFRTNPFGDTIGVKML